MVNKDLQFCARLYCRSADGGDGGGDVRGEYPKGKCPHRVASKSSSGLL